jgi:hypothetical protein
MLTKTPVNINFTKGIDTKTDPYQLPVDSFLQMQNSVFTTTGRLTKRNGYPLVTTLPNTLETTITTLNDNLIATGSNLYALSQDTNTWVDQGLVQPVQLSTLPLIRVSTSQTAPDTAVAPSGLVCLTYVDSGNAYYQISDSVTGIQVVQKTALPSTASNPRVFLLGSYFVIMFLATVSGASHLQYVAIPTSSPSTPGPATDFNPISTSAASLTAGYDGYVVDGNLYAAWAATSTTIKVAYLTSSLSYSTVSTITGHTANLMSVTVDNNVPNVPIIWATFWDSSTTNVYVAAYNSTLVNILTPTLAVAGVNLNRLTTYANATVNTIIIEVANTYASPYPITGIATNYVQSLTISQTGAFSPPVTLLRSVGLASKIFIGPNNNIYFLVSYGESNHDLSSPGPDQNTYFLTDLKGNIYMRLAYSNGGGYSTSQVIPTVTTLNGTYYVPYLVNDFLSTVNKTTNSAVPINAIYTQTGVNLATFTINDTGQYSSEIAGALHLTGGQLWEYDGVKPVEHGFHVWPDNVAAVWSATGGAIAAIPVSGGSNTNAYYYQFTYEWTDNQGNLHRSAPSVPVGVTTTGSGTAGSITLYVPTLRLTYKNPLPYLSESAQPGTNPVRIVGYRWSQGQQVYYQFTSLTAPTINDSTKDFVTIVDTSSDAQIIGNNIIYTTGGVIEDIAAPASIHSALFNNRLWLVDAEDRNLLWYSKQVIESTPVEMSDLLTIYVAPTTGAQGSTGPIYALSAMDDKLIIFKKDAIYYINGIGPDNTGANSTYSDPVYITGAVGCSNPNSIVLMPNGLMFQSDKGIWLLGRDLSTNYIGAPVEVYNGQTIMSAQTIPATTQVRFILENNITLMYDYFFNQWGTFTNIAAISATLWQGYHTYLNKYGQVLQESPGTYLDNSTPVLMSVTSAWINIAGLQGFERLYYANVLGTYYTPFKLNVQFAYNYNSSPTQSTLVLPDNFGGSWGAVPYWGGGKGWGNSEGNVFTARIFNQIQKCQSFQISMQEVYDSTMGQTAGAGLTLSGLQLSVGVKRGTRTQSAAKSFG